MHADVFRRRAIDRYRITREKQPQPFALVLDRTDSRHIENVDDIIHALEKYNISVEHVAIDSSMVSHQLLSQESLHSTVAL